jgi:hypothetical protein
MSDDLACLKNELAELAASFKSPNQLKLAKGLAAGKSQEKAYIDAGYKSKKPAVDAGKAIERCPSIARYKNLFQKIEQLESLPKQIATKEAKRQMLWDIANKCFSEHSEKFEGRGDEAEFVGFVFDSRGAIAAVAELNKMDGDLATIKTDLTTLGNPITPTKITREIIYPKAE